MDSFPSEPLGSPRRLDCLAYPFCRGSSDPEIEPGSPALQVDSLPTELPEKTLLQSKKERKKQRRKINIFGNGSHYSYMQDHRVWTQQDEGRIQMLGRIRERGDIWCFSFVWIKWNEYFWCFLKAWSVLLNLEEVSWNSFRNPVWPIFYSHASGKPYQQGNGFRGKWFWDLLAGPMCKLSDSMQMENSNTCSNWNMKCSIPPLEQKRKSCKGPKS